MKQNATNVSNNAYYIYNKLFFVVNFFFLELESLDAIFWLVDATSEGQIVECCRKLECVTLIVEREDGLYGTLTERGLADD